MERIIKFLLIILMTIGVIVNAFLISFAEDANDKMSDNLSDTTSISYQSVKDKPKYNPCLVGILSGCVPGLGHFYNGNESKGWVFCLLGLPLRCILLGLWAEGIPSEGTPEHSENVKEGLITTGCLASSLLDVSTAYKDAKTISDKEKKKIEERLREQSNIEQSNGTSE